MLLPLATDSEAGPQQESKLSVGKAGLRSEAKVAVIDVNRLYAKPIGSVEAILGKPVGKHTYGQDSALGWGGEWTEYRVKGCAKVLVNLENGRILMVAISIPAVTADNVKDKWQFLLGKVGLSTNGVKPNWKGWDKGGTVGFDDIVLQGVKLGADPDHSKLAHVGNDVVNSIIFLKENNMLVIYAGS